MITVPSDRKQLLKLANDLVEQCNVSVQDRCNYYRMLNTVCESGRPDGPAALINLIEPAIDREAAFMYSPVELKFAIDFENPYPKDIYAQAAQAAKVITRQWFKNSTAFTFGRGVFDSLKYGCAIHKQWCQLERSDEDEGDIGDVSYHDKLVMPWQFGVYNEAETDIRRQPCVTETNSITMPEVWRRIWHLPNAKELYQRILTHATTSSPVFEPQSFAHEILSTSQLATGLSSAQRPGGLISIGGNPNRANMGPKTNTPLVNVREIWVQDDEDYTTIIMIEPDIIVAPFQKKENLLSKGSGLQPYRVIRPNDITNYFWGKSEILNLIEPQGLLADWCDDMRRLFGLQVDKILGLVGAEGMTDERYGKMRTAGWIDMPAGADIKDLTPQIPTNGLDMIKFMMEVIDKLSSAPPVLQGQGEQGVRAGSHAAQLTKNASPTLRDRSLLIEHQLSDAADLTLAIREAKDHRFYWTKADNPDEDVEATKFLMSDMPDDWRVIVDSHSASPIFSDENAQLVFAAHSKGIVDAPYVIDNTNLPNKEAALVSYREREALKAAQMQQLLQAHPELQEKMKNKELKAVTGGKK